jgi:AcrR family transcriptional regulator
MPEGRLHDIARAACEVFIAKGYRATLMTDVAERLNLSHALLYRSVESKEALVELAFRWNVAPAATLRRSWPGSSTSSTASSSRIGCCSS